MDAAHHIVLTWSYRYHLMDRIYSQVPLREFFHEGKLRLDRFRAQMCEVQVDIAPVRALESSSLLDLGHLGPRQDVSGAKLHLVGNVPLHDPFAILVQ